MAFSTWVIDFARYHGWRVVHFRAARTAGGWRTPVQGDGTGYPDLTMVKGDRLIFAELKRETGRTTVEQERWLSTLRATAKVEVYVWKPKDRPEIERVLGASMRPVWAQGQQQSAARSV